MDLNECLFHGPGIGARELTELLNLFDLDALLGEMLEGSSAQIVRDSHVLNRVLPTCFVERLAAQPLRGDVSLVKTAGADRHRSCQTLVPERNGRQLRRACPRR